MGCLSTRCVREYMGGREGSWSGQVRAMEKELKEGGVGSSFRSSSLRSVSLILFSYMRNTHFLSGFYCIACMNGAWHAIGGH